MQEQQVNASLHMDLLKDYLFAIKVSSAAGHHKCILMTPKILSEV